VPAIDRRQRVRIGSRRDEVEVSRAVHARHGVERIGVRALDRAAVGERQVVDPLRVLEIGSFRRIVAVVEEKEMTVPGQERLHRIVIVALDGDPLRIREWLQADAVLALTRSEGSQEPYREGSEDYQPRKLSQSIPRAIS
jgi:hypothetical protein